MEKPTEKLFKLYNLKAFGPDRSKLFTLVCSRIDICNSHSIFYPAIDDRFPVRLFSALENIIIEDGRIIATFENGNYVQIRRYR